VRGYTTQRIVFNAAGVMTVLDEGGSVGVAKKAGLPVVMSAGGKVFASKSIRETKPEKSGPMKVWEKISKDLSTVSSHPGNTQVGCTCKMMMEDQASPTKHALAHAVTNRFIQSSSAVGNNSGFCSSAYWCMPKMPGR